MTLLPCFTRPWAGLEAAVWPVPGLEAEVWHVPWLEAEVWPVQLEEEAGPSPGLEPAVQASGGGTA